MKLRLGQRTGSQLSKKGKWIDNTPHHPVAKSLQGRGGEGSTPAAVFLPSGHHIGKIRGRGGLRKETRNL